MAVRPSVGDQEARQLAEFSHHFGIPFRDPTLLKLALTHRSYLSVTGQGPRDSNERLEFLGDSVLGLVTSEFLYRQNPEEHEGQLTKTKSLLVSKAILSRRALALGLGRFVLMSHSEVESGGRQRLSILADAFESVIGAIYLDQGFEAARQFIHRALLKDTREIASDKRHANYKSHLQEYVQSTFHTHPVYRIRGEMGPDHSKQFVVEVMVGKRMLGTGRGRNKKEAEQAAARNALDQVGGPGPDAEDRDSRASVGTAVERSELPLEAEELELEEDRVRRRGRRGGRNRRDRESPVPTHSLESESDYESETSSEPETPRMRSSRPAAEFAAPPRGRTRPLHEDFEEIGRPEGPLEERHVDPYDWEGEQRVRTADAQSERSVESDRSSRSAEARYRAREVEPAADESDEPRAEAHAYESVDSDEGGQFEPRPGTLFSHDDVAPPPGRASERGSERAPERAPESPRFGRKAARSRGRGR